MKNKLPVYVGVVIALFVLIPAGAFLWNNYGGGVTPTATPSPTPDTRCIVTVSEQRYDITQLLVTHTGGDKMLKCNTDLTESFFKRHDQKLLDEDMAKYKI